jgi:nitrogen fixation NifU-like protein
MPDPTADLYQELLLDHYRQPRQRRPLAEDDADVTLHNPLCGDCVRLQLGAVDGTLADISFDGEGCAINIAAASIMSEHVRGMRSTDAAALAADVCAALTADNTAAPPITDDSLNALYQVRQYPMRLRCATLAWEALALALEASTRESPADP